ncbi:MAG: N-acetylmuramidase family protein [Rhodanobacter sp.]
MANFRIPGPTLWGEQMAMRGGGQPMLFSGVPASSVFRSPLAASPMLFPMAGGSVSGMGAGVCLAGSLPTPAPDVSFLFRMCLNPKRGIGAQDYADAAALLGVEVAAIQAVAKVETAGSAFDDYGRPRILFERHYFHRLTQGRYDKRHPDISNSLAGGYGKFSAQYGKLERAYVLDAVAALESASWGRFQIMGSNYRDAGFVSVQEFVLALARTEAAHLQAFASFVSANKGLHKALEKKDWAAFAKAYNGKGYKKNDYDSKLKNAYDKFAKGISK